MSTVQAVIVLGVMLVGLPFGKQLEAADFAVRLFRFVERP